MIELTHLTKTYAGALAVNDLSLTVKAGEIFGFIGPNGAGKTTTIKMIGGLLAPTSGRVVIDGLDMAKQPEDAKRKIGFIPDRPFLYEKLTGMEFLRFSTELYGIATDHFPELAAKYLGLFSLLEKSNALIESYSHGMKQRLIMAAALMRDPEVIIVDEPMVGLDPSAIMMVKDLFRRLAQGGTCIFMSTHTLEVAEDLCHRIGIIHMGSLIATGTIEELKERSKVRNRGLEEVFLRLTESS
jgi:ABC-2 type transport system ATP-binding protein